MNPLKQQIKKTKKGIVAWAVIQKSRELELEDVFSTYREAAEYKRDCFEPEHEAKVVKVKVKITILK